MDLTEKMSIEIDKRLDELSSLDLGSNEYSKAVSNIVMLYDAHNKELHSNADYWDRIEARDKQAEAQLEARKSEAKERRNERFFKYGIEALGILVPTIGYALLFRDGLRFEKEGVVSSTFVRNLIGKAKF